MGEAIVSSCTSRSPHPRR